MLKSVVGAVAIMAILAVTGSVSSSLRAEPGDDASADELIKRGVELRRLGNDGAALKEFRKAYGQARTPRSAGQLGLCERALGDWAGSVRHLSEALAAASDPWVIKNHTPLERSLEAANRRVGRIEIFGSPPGAEVFVNGRAAGKLPLAEPVAVNVGSADVEVRAPGFRTGNTAVQVAAEQMASVVLRLKPESERAGIPEAPIAHAAASRPAAATENPAPAPTPPTPPAASVDLTSRPDTEPSATPVYEKPLFWVVVGAVAVGAAAAGIVLATRGNHYPDVQGHGTFSNPGN